MKKLLVLALILVAASAFAQTSNMANGIGIYFDTSGMSNTLMTAAPFPATDQRVCGGHQHQPGGQHWRLGVQACVTPRPLFAASYVTNPADAFNSFAAPNFQLVVAPRGACDDGDGF